MVPDSSIIECSRGGEEEHDGNEGVEHHGQHEGDQVEQGDVREEHGDVHGRVPVQSKVALGNHSESLDAGELDVGEEEPGRAVEQGEHPAAADDAPGAGQRADVLKCSHYT